MAEPAPAPRARADVPPVWRRCLELAWESHRAGSLPVGAVVVDPAGRVVAEGRNRYVEPDAPSGQLASTYLAHAELNALAALAPGDYEEHAVYTTLEPCLLCTAALIQCHVGAVHYAARDHLWRGLERLPGVNEHVARRWPARVGPLPGPLAVWAGVLPLLWTLARSPAGAVVAAQERHAPTVLGLARNLHESRPAALEQGSVHDALDALWPRLERAARSEGGSG